jgi:hypothetical protein
LWCMPQRTLRFRIRPDGRVEEHVEGVEGDDCLLLTEHLEAVLGTVERRQPTSDAYITTQTQTQSQFVEPS